MGDVADKDGATGVTVVAGLPCSPSFPSILRFSICPTFPELPLVAELPEFPRTANIKAHIHSLRQVPESPELPALPEVPEVSRASRASRVSDFVLSHHHHPVSRLLLLSSDRKSVNESRFSYEQPSLECTHTRACTQHAYTCLRTQVQSAYSQHTVSITVSIKNT